jgi:hypothetical protein
MPYVSLRHLNSTHDRHQVWASYIFCVGCKLHRLTRALVFLETMNDALMRHIEVCTVLGAASTTSLTQTKFTDTNVQIATRSVACRKLVLQPAPSRMSNLWTARNTESRTGWVVQLSHESLHTKYCMSPGLSRWVELLYIYIYIYIYILTSLSTSDHSYYTNLTHQLR